MAGNPLASLPGLPQRPSLARSSASETRLTQPGIEAARSRKLNSAPTAAFRLKEVIVRDRLVAARLRLVVSLDGQKNELIEVDDVPSLRVQPGQSLAQTLSFSI